jgi:hypothetical protein
MSRTLKAIQRHMTQPSKSEVVERSAPKLVGEWPTARAGNILWICAEKIALGLRAFAINQTRNS